MSRHCHSDLVAEFLRGALASGAKGVPKLEVLARTAGLLGERQSITHAKAFKRAKKSLGIRSVRNGFGSRGEWLWVLDQPVSEAKRRVPPEWVTGVASLGYDHPPADIPPHRWRQFVGDCNNGNLYRLKLNESRAGFALAAPASGATAGA